MNFYDNTALGAFPEGHPKFIRQVAQDQPGSHTCSLFEAPRKMEQLMRSLTQQRNILAHQRFSEEFQLGIRDLYAQRLGDLKNYLISRYTEQGTLFTAHKVETLIATVMLLNESKSHLGRFAAITLCLNSFTGKAISTHVIRFLHLNEKDFIGTDEDLQSSELRSVLDNWDRLNDSRFIEKIRNVASYCMAFSVLESMGLPESVAEIVYAEFKVQKKSKQVTSFIHAILDAIEFTCSQLLVCVAEGSLSPLLHSPSTYTNWFDKTQLIEKWTSMLSCDPDTLEFSFQMYEKELIECIANGHQFIKHAKSNNDRKMLTVVVNRLELFLADYQTKHIVGQSRIMPFGLSLFGNSSVGKSSFSDIIFSYSARVLGQKDEPEYKYTRNFRDPFWSGFKSHMWFILLDDVGSIKPSAVNGTDPSADEIISLMNTVSLLCNMADLSEKGRVAARPLVVVATTNHPWMNVHHYAYHPTALMRRFPYRITVKVNKKYQMDDAQTMLDPSKCVVDYSTSYPDFWDITVEKVLAAPLPEDGSTPACTPILVPELDNVGMSDFLPWLRIKLLTHMASQKDIKVKMASMAKVQMCEHCVPIGNCKICPQLQVGLNAIVPVVNGLSLKERILGYLLFIYLWWFAGLSRERAHINAFRRAIPAMRIANSAARGTDSVLSFIGNPFAGLSNMVLEAPQLPTRAQIGSVAQSFYDSAMANKKYILVTTTIAVTAGMIKALRTVEALQFSFMRPTPQSEKSAAKWTNDTIHLSPLTVSRQSKSMKGLNDDQMNEIIGRNVIAITVFTDHGTSCDNNMLALGGNIYLINKHVLDLCSEEFRMECVFMPVCKAGTRNTSLKVSKKSIKKIIGDIVLIELNNFPPAARLDHLLPSRGFDVRAHGRYIKRSTQGDLIVRPATHISKGTLNLLQVEGYWSECATVKGDCGSALIASTAYGPILMGIHTAGKATNRAFCSRIYKEDVQDLILIDAGIVSLQEGSKVVGLYPTINRRDPVLFLEESNCAIYGSLSTGTSNMKSNVRETAISPFFKGKGWKTTHETPLLGTWKPWYHAMKDMSEPNLMITSADAQWLANKTISQYMSQVPEDELRLLQLYDIQTAVSGAPGVNYVNSLAMNTSLGFPWRKPKREKISFDEDQGIFVLDDELTSSVERMIETYRQGERCNPIFCASEKDEARAAQKNALGKIRIFMGAPTPLVVVMRMFFGSLIRVIQRNPGSFGCSVGINAHSKEWHDLAVAMLKHGDGNIFDGDYQAYDKKMEAVLLYCAIVEAGDHIIKHLDDLCGFTELELKKIYRSMAADVAFAFIDFNGTLSSFLRNHVSGEPLTVIVNCFGNGMYVRFAYRDVVLDDPELLLFMSRITERFYGDDNMIAVSSDIISKFNFSSMKTSLAKINVVYTRADKKEGSYISKSLSEIEFLKRGFVYSEDLSRYVGPLALASIQKSFLIGLCSKSITQEERDLATMNSGLREFFFHGREVYEENRSLILECCATLSIKYNPRNFPPYDHYLEMYRTNDIVHFEFYELEEDDGEEILQCGEVYLTSGFDNEQFKPIYIEEDILYEITPQHNFRVTHIAFIPRWGLLRILNILGYAGRYKRNFMLKARFLRLRGKCSSTYRSSLHVLMYNKLILKIEEDKRWMSLEASIDSGTLESIRDGQVNPPCHPEQNRIFNNELFSNSRSSITAVTDNRMSEGTGNHIPDVSSDAAEHCLRQDFEEIEEFQSGKQTILDFSDKQIGETVDMSVAPDSTRQTSVYKDASLSQFLERPVLLDTITWTEGTNIAYAAYPWFKFFNDDRIKRKIANYSLLRCNLHVKVMINASPFYYGQARAFYQPLIDYSPETFREIGGQDGWKVPVSQIPGFYIYPQDSAGGSMTLPFFYHKAWLPLYSTSAMQQMGLLKINSFTPLLNANSVASSDVTIQIYAWAENVELSGPTVAEVLQAGDEYEMDGPISGVSSAVANAAGALGKVPGIGPYAMATKMVATNIGAVARYFGFTNVPNLESEVPQHPGSHYGMASTNLSTPYESLTLDDKNEISIDPKVAGILSTDELLISEFCGRESWIWQSNWQASDAVDKILFQSRVLPELIRNEGGSYYRQSTPMALINRLFANWRGDIEFRFQFICTQYHRGRVRITFDPHGNLFTNSITSTTSITKIVDISEDTNVVIRVPYMQAQSYLKTAVGLGSHTQNMNGGTVALTRDELYDNGQISVRVFTKQSSPVATADIKMNVFVSGCDLEFAAPTDAPTDYSYEQLQSGEEKTLDTQCQTDDTNLNLIHFGEKVTSLRQLFRRKNYYYSTQLKSGPLGNTTPLRLNTITLPRLPVQYGYTTKGGFPTYKTLVPAELTAANYVSNSPMTLLTPCFVGQTGSVVYTTNVDSPQPVTSVYMGRANQAYNYTAAVGFSPIVSEAPVNAASADISRLMYLGKPTGGAGRVLTNQYTQSALTARLPMYSNRRFLATKIDNSQTASKVDGTELDTFTTVVVTKPIVHNGIEASTQVQFYYMAGVDFNLLFFKNVPTTYVYNLPSSGLPA